MGVSIKRRFACMVLVSVLAFIAGAVCILPTAGAYAAEDSSTQGLAAAQSSVSVQDLVVNPSIPAPTNKASQYEVYSTYFFFNAGPNAQAYCNLYMEYRIKGGAWKKTGYMYSYNDYEMKGLRPNKTYQARLFYQNIYTGEIGNKSRIVTFKTGPKKKLAIKSVKVKAIKLRKHRGTYYGYYTGLPLGHYTYYTFKLRTTVTFKKKPKGAKYVMINGKKFKAKKKRYTVTTKKLVRYYNSPRGKKYTVSVCTYRNKTWKGYSKLYQKKRKVK